MINDISHRNLFVRAFHRLSNGKCANTIAVLKTSSGKYSGKYKVGYNSQGINNEEIQSILDELRKVNKFNRKCAEVNVLSSAYGTEELEGSEIYVTYLYREEKDINDLTGKYKEPCDVCESLLKTLGIEVVKW